METAETLKAVFSELYTNFLLRDVAGKIVPGGFLLFSISAAFRSPSNVFRIFTKGEYSLVLVVFLAGMCWTMVLGLQAVAEAVHIWSYFPAVPGVAMQESFDAATERMQQFFLVATEQERLQYERFVVIKEATGNLFFVTLLSIPFWLCYLRRLLKLYPSVRDIPIVRMSMTAALAIVVSIGLFKMNAEHVHRQYMFATTVLKLHPSPGKAGRTEGTQEGGVRTLPVK